MSAIDESLVLSMPLANFSRLTKSPKSICNAFSFEASMRDTAVFPTPGVPVIKIIFLFFFFIFIIIFYLTLVEKLFTFATLPICIGDDVGY